MGAAADMSSGFRVIDCDMVGGPVRSEIVFHGCVGMAPGDFGVLRVTSVLCRPEKHLKVDEVVHYGVVTSEIPDLAGP